MRTTWRDVRLAVAEESRSAHDPLRLERSVAGQIARVVPFDLWCGLTLDPGTGNPTGGYHDEGLPGERLPRLVEIEHGADPDFGTMSTLARRRSPVQTLASATAGDLARSMRYRDVLQPSGVRHELRAVFRMPAGAWGAIVLMRGTDEPDFDRDEVALLESLSKVVAEGLRRATVLASAAGKPPDGPGLVLCNVSAAIEVTHITDHARSLLDELQDGVDGALPYALVSLVQAARYSPAYGERRTRLKTRAGRWLTLHAIALSAETVSVIVEPTQVSEVTALMLDAFRLTPREREVAMLAARGMSNAEIAEQLFLSAHTVGDHLKSAFNKTGVSRRAELAARLGFDPLGT